ncbi:MAG: lipoyl(octanoyl) transferase LipB [Pseudobdellovibrionaceae bacterium]
MEVKWLGLQDYELVLQWQKKMQASIKGSKKILLLGLEHPSVITLGRRSQAQKDILWSEDQLQQSQITIENSDRGGRATLHSPGQLVIYPIVDLSMWKISVPDFVQLLLANTQSVLALGGIDCYVDTDRPGVYTTQGKLAFCGLRIEQGVSRHGLSINVSNDLSLFESSVACGHGQQSLDKVQNWPRSVASTWTTKNLFEMWSVECYKKFNSKSSLRSLSAVGSAFP